MTELLQSSGQLDLAAVFQSGCFFPSPTAWEDQVFYFLMLDRFSDAQEQGYRDVAGQPAQNGITPMYTEADRGNVVATETDAAQWREAGSRYVGGTLFNAVQGNPAIPFAKLTPQSLPDSDGAVWSVEFITVPEAGFVIFQ